MALLSPALHALIVLAQLAGATVCDVDDDCPDRALCVAGICLEPCTSDHECPADLICEQASCRAESSCGNDADCPGQWWCESGQCATPRPAPTPPPALTLAPPPEVAPTPTALVPRPVTAVLPPPVPAAPEPDPAIGAAGLLWFAAGTFVAAWLVPIPITAAASDGSLTGDAADQAAIPFAGPFLIMDQRELTTGGTIFYGAAGGLQIAAPVIALFGLLALGEQTTPPGADSGLRWTLDGERIGLAGSF
jgi:hypothetical protein